MPLSQDFNTPWYSWLINRIESISSAGFFSVLLSPMKLTTNVFITHFKSRTVLPSGGGVHL